jgi:hypothetical protein
MGPVRLIGTPISRVANSRLFQLAVVIAAILLLDHYAYDHAALQAIAEGLKSAVTATVQLCSDFLRVGILTDPMLQVAVMIVYVYVIFLLIFYLLRLVIRALIDVAGRNNFLWLRNAIARERGVAAYRAWLPLERIRPPDCPQEQWEQRFAWPADNRPPYPPLPHRMARAAVSYVVVIGIAAVLLQLFTPLAVLTWLRALI